MTNNNVNMDVVKDEFDMAKADAATEVPTRTLADVNNEYTKLAMLAGDKAFRKELLKAESNQIFIEMQKLNEEGLALNKLEAVKTDE